MAVKTLTMAALIGMASAFMPSTQISGIAKSSSALKMSFEDRLGAQPPL
eukprot:CAMPEP_0117881462 /NCGR_PEP_ID=MMETSP0950-20121206/16837_1 /TAXON_ID=44440 /ORGANISM="Chattonella subsalsa, Strain CCMP2191" /LENGTH=48 /DNA_ID= /DNA_START= /DNA_END= /DNA_ORIENTATION=